MMLSAPASAIRTASNNNNILQWTSTSTGNPFLSSAKRNAECVCVCVYRGAEVCGNGRQVWKCRARQDKVNRSIGAISLRAHSLLRLHTPHKNAHHPLNFSTGGAEPAPSALLRSRPQPAEAGRTGRSWTSLVLSSCKCFHANFRQLKTTGILKLPLALQCLHKFTVYIIDPTWGKVVVKSCYFREILILVDNCDAVL